MRAETGKTDEAGGARTAPAVPDASHAAPAPGGVYLCQVEDGASCGACCGLYNCADASRGTLEDRVASRTEAFRRIPRDADAITDFQVRMERGDPQPRPYPDFYHCPFLGFIDGHRRRVGCLLHPMADGNDGIDYRGLSFYGGLACRDYFCPSYRTLAASHKEIVKAVCTDWYLYGLVITEDRLLGAFFGEIEKRLNRPLSTIDVLPHSDSRLAVREFLALKLDWPHRLPDARGPGNYFFNDGLYPKPAVDYARLGAAPSDLDPILHELSSGFSRTEELNLAESRIERLLERILRAIEVPGADGAY